MAGVPVTPGAGMFQAMPGPCMLDTSKNACGREEVLSLAPPKEVQLSDAGAVTGGDPGVGGTVEPTGTPPMPAIGALGDTLPAPPAAGALGAVCPAVVTGETDVEPEPDSAAPGAPPAPTGPTAPPPQE